jgi:membrane protease YdiL (CAAX protease family)
VLVYGLVWLTGLGGVDAHGLVRDATDPGSGDIVRAAAVTILAGLSFGGVLALGEELGWRGLLVPELFRYSGFGATAIISGIVWALYHYPAILGTEYHSAAPIGYAMAAFTVSVMGVSVIAGWLRLRSGSVWPAVLLHASHNTFVQSIFDPVTIDGRATPFLTTEFGAGLMAFYIVVALYFWRRRDQLVRPPESAPAEPAFV